MDFRTEDHATIRPLSANELDVVNGGLGEKIMPKVAATAIKFLKDNGYTAPANDMLHHTCN